MRPGSGAYSASEKQFKGKQDADSTWYLAPDTWLPLHGRGPLPLPLACAAAEVFLQFDMGHLLVEIACCTDSLIMQIDNPDHLAA